MFSENFHFVPKVMTGIFVQAAFINKVFSSFYFKGFFQKYISQLYILLINIFIFTILMIIIYLHSILISIKLPKHTSGSSFKEVDRNLIISILFITAEINGQAAQMKRQKIIIILKTPKTLLVINQYLINKWRWFYEYFSIYAYHSQIIVWKD